MARSSQQLLNELAVARLSLLDPEKKSAYDEQLRVEFGRRAARAPVSAPASKDEPLTFADTSDDDGPIVTAAKAAQVAPIARAAAAAPLAKAAPGRRPRRWHPWSNRPLFPPGTVAPAAAQATRAGLFPPTMSGSAAVAPAPVAAVALTSANVAAAKAATLAKPISPKPSPIKPVAPVVAADAEPDEELLDLLTPTELVIRTRGRSYGDGAWKGAAARGLLAGAIVCRPADFLRILSADHPGPRSAVDVGCSCRYSSRSCRRLARR